MSIAVMPESLHNPQKSAQGATKSWDLVARDIRLLSLSPDERKVVAQLKELTSIVGHKVSDAIDAEDLQAAFEVLLDDDQALEARDKMISLIVGLPEYEDIKRDHEAERASRGLALFFMEVFGHEVLSEATRLGRHIAGITSLQIELDRHRDASQDVALEHKKTVSTKEMLRSCIKERFPPAFNELIFSGILCDLVVMTLFHRAFAKPKAGSFYGEPPLWLRKGLLDLGAEYAANTAKLLYIQLSDTLKEEALTELYYSFGFEIPDMKQLDKQMQQRQELSKRLKAAKPGESIFGEPL